MLSLMNSTVDWQSPEGHLILRPTEVNPINSVGLRVTVFWLNLPFLSERNWDRSLN